MARKPKRRPQTRSRRSAAAPPAAGTATGPRPAAPARSGQAARVGGEQAIVRAVEMSLAPGAPVKRGGRIVLESGDPAIPLDRVPYFLTDLARLGVVAAAMVALLIVGALFVIPLVVR